MWNASRFCVSSLRLSGSNFIGEIGTKLEHKLEQWGHVIGRLFQFQFGTANKNAGSFQISNWNDQSECRIVPILFQFWNWNDQSEHRIVPILFQFWNWNDQSEHRVVPISKWIDQSECSIVSISNWNNSASWLVGCSKFKVEQSKHLIGQFLHFSEALKSTCWRKRN